MPTKPKKPPIDKRAIRERLEYAQARGLLVNVRRWIPRSDRIDGFVVTIGTHWVVLQRLSDRVTFDGWTLLRLKDVQAVSIEVDADAFEIKALKARGQWPPVSPDLDADDVADAIRSAARMSPLVTVHDEFARPDVCWIGAVRSVGSRKVHLVEVSPRARWAKDRSRFALADITRLDVGAGYEEALYLAAGPAPAREAAGRTA
ncbi:hypothetical protein IC607_03765 [Cellulomonas sp. JH27-2]|uniref:hypothetical protein n=1 Tax=Cellulomonas sp. JH27-2 TaxID=2774139 RepID=UPI00178105DE|nr:hypothetical protein [Cellulomonas sp. JH27-2]MBD8058082.1 hypothetical protein [Cellulomonas sp. JH27-2]